MKDKSATFTEITAIIIFTIVLIFNAFLATNKIENRKKYETQHFRNN